MLFGAGLAHLEQYALDHYSQIPTIGTLFAANFVAATVLACLLAAPRGDTPILRLCGIGVAAGSLAGLWLSEHGGLFGFSESGYRPAIALSVALELATIILLAAPTSRARARARTSR
jgi:hypothetical protein